MRAGRERDGFVYPEMFDVLRWMRGGCHGPPASSGSPEGLSRQSSRPPGQLSPVHFLSRHTCLDSGHVIVTCLVVCELRVNQPTGSSARTVTLFSMTRRDCVSSPLPPRGCGEHDRQGCGGVHLSADPIAVPEGFGRAKL